MRKPILLSAVAAALFFPRCLYAGDNSALPRLPEKTELNCRAWADAAGEQLAKDLKLSAKDKDAMSQGNLTMCLWAEAEAMKDLVEVVFPIATESMIRSCARRIGNDDAEQLRKTLNCLNETLQSLPDDRLPKGIAAIYRDFSPVRFWRLSDCIQARRPGEACTIK